MPIGTYTPPPLQIITQNFFHFRCILLQISHKKCFFYKYFYTRAFWGYSLLTNYCVTIMIMLTK